MTKQKRRRLALIHILSDLSRDGWRNARPEDYRPLEIELNDLDKEKVEG